MDSGILVAILVAFCIGAAWLYYRRSAQGKTTGKPEGFQDWSFGSDTGRELAQINLDAIGGHVNVEAGRQPTYDNRSAKQVMDYVANRTFTPDVLAGIHTYNFFNDEQARFAQLKGGEKGAEKFGGYANDYATSALPRPYEAKQYGYQAAQGGIDRYHRAESSIPAAVLSAAEREAYYQGGANEDAVHTQVDAENFSSPTNQDPTLRTFTELATDMVVDDRTRENHNLWVMEMQPYASGNVRFADRELDMEATIDFRGLRRPQGPVQNNALFITEIDSSDLSKNNKITRLQ